MWAKLLQTISKYLLIPLLTDLAVKLSVAIKDGVVAVIKHYQNKREEKRVQEEAKRKLEEHRNAQTREERRRTFGGLSVLAFCFLACSFGSCSSSDLKLSLITENCEQDPTYVEVEVEGVKKQYIDVQDSVCFCRDYKFSLGYVGPVGVVRDMPYNYCKQMPGFPQWDEASSFWEIVRGRIFNWSTEPRSNQR